MKFFLSFLIVFLLFPQSSFAASNYVLPYPSRMPGSLTYRFHVIFEEVSKYWYFGDFAQFTYNLKLSDKYLVEAKTLFEYGQYFLGSKSLEKSNMYFSKIHPIIQGANKENKDTSKKTLIINEASVKHIEILEKIDIETPDLFIWESEKKSPETLYIKETILDSINLRARNL